MTLDPLDPSPFRAPPARAHGAAPQLAWVKLADCGVDHEYQRDMTYDSRRKVEKIAAEFDWSCFAPLIVAPAVGGRYALIDGQHRATAALLVGEDSAPAMIVIADKTRQAKSFAAINGTVTKMSPLALYRAARAAGDAEALAVDEVASRCGVRVLTYPLVIERMKPGDCTAPSTLLKAHRDYGAEILARALTAIMASRGDKRGLVNSVQVRGLCLLFKENSWSAETIRRAFAHIDLADAAAVARREGMMGTYADLRDEVMARLKKLAKRAP